MLVFIAFGVSLELPYTIGRAEPRCETRGIEHGKPTAMKGGESAIP